MKNFSEILNGDDPNSVEEDEIVEPEVMRK